MSNENYEILSYEETADGIMAAVLVIRGGEPKAIYHIPSFGFTLPPQESEGDINPKKVEEVEHL